MEKHLRLAHLITVTGHPVISHVCGALIFSGISGTACTLRPLQCTTAAACISLHTRNEACTHRNIQHDFISASDKWTRGGEVSLLIVVIHHVVHAHMVQRIRIVVPLHSDRIIYLTTAASTSVMRTNFDVTAIRLVKAWWITLTDE